MKKSKTRRIAQSGQIQIAFAKVRTRTATIPGTIKTDRSAEDRRDDHTQS
jgi:hypothetical protein